MHLISNPVHLEGSRGQCKQIRGGMVSQPSKMINSLGDNVSKIGEAQRTLEESADADHDHIH